mmetsp:Transcript_8666/g.18094  ORF Transcript_8666/g.18094 Transcript_8666/m.18094 type:complete len:215 (-) Transcript_8666:799-1443(-)
MQSPPPCDISFAGKGDHVFGSCFLHRECHAHESRPNRRGLWWQRGRTRRERKNLHGDNVLRNLRNTERVEQQHHRRLLRGIPALHEKRPSCPRGVRDDAPGGRCSGSGSRGRHQNALRHSPQRLEGYFPGDPDFHQRCLLARSAAVQVLWGKQTRPLARQCLQRGSLSVAGLWAPDPRVRRGFHQQPRSLQRGHPLHAGSQRVPVDFLCRKGRL